MVVGGMYAYPMRLPLTRFAATTQPHEIRPSWMLEQPQAKLRQQRDDVVEDVGLDALVRHPPRVVAENVKLDRQPMWRRRQLSY